jgi:hypothetical protein
VKERGHYAPPLLKLILLIMKKILLLLLIVVFPGNLKAQDEGSSIVLNRFYIGAKAGYGIVEFESADELITDFSERTYRNIAYGIIAGVRITGKLSIQAEGVYAQYGGNNILVDHIYDPDNPLLISYSTNSTVDHVDMDLYYVDIPILIRYSLSDRNFSPYVYAGANWAINITGYTTITRAITDAYGTIYREFNDGITEQLQYNEFAPLVGAGFNLGIGKFIVFGDVRYKYGIMNLSNVQNRTGFTSNALWLSGGLLFNL